MAAPVTVPSSLTAYTATPNQPEASVVLTSGSSIHIQASARTAFGVLLATDKYSEWNTWCPALEFPSGQSIRKPGSKGTLKCYMQAQDRSYSIPIEIQSVTDGGGQAERYELVWQGGFLPSWFAMAERVQTITRVSENECELRQWESMSGWGVYLMKWFMGIQKQLNEANTRYAAEFKAHAEKVHRGGGV